MKKVLVAAGILGMIAFGATPALAHEQTVGGCAFSANSPPDSNNTFTGAITLRAHARDANNVPVAGTTWLCELVVNGAVVATTGDTSDETGFAVNGGPISYQRPEGATVEMCTTIRHTDGHTERTCVPATSIEIPPQVVQDLIVQVTSIPDPPLCPILASLDALVNGPPVEIDHEGDVYIDGDKFWDCMPYDPPTV